MTEQQTEGNVHAGADTAPDQNAQDEAATAQASDQVVGAQDLEGELASARREAEENRDRYLRTRADMENYKKRIERTYADLAKSSKKDLLRRLLQVKDNLERALRYGNDSGTNNEGIIEGVRLTEYQLNQLLEQEGVKPIEAQGREFDPVTEEAVQTIHDPSMPDHQVVQVVRQGYTYGDEVLRPAQVIVNVHQNEE